MITIASAMQQDEIKELLEGYNEEGMTLHLKKNKESSCSLKQVQKIRKLRLKSKGTNQSTALGNSPLFSINSCLENGLKR